MTVQSHLNDVHVAIMELIESKRPAVPTPEDVAFTLSQFDDGVKELNMEIADFNRREQAKRDGCPICGSPIIDNKCSQPARHS